MSTILMATAFMQASYVWYFRRMLSRQKIGTRTSPSVTQNSNLSEEEKADEVAVVLALRGADPSLTDCLAGISIQRYPNFQLHIVVDDRQDPALNIAKRFFQDCKIDSTIHIIANVRDSCSLKCSAILTALDAIPSSTEIIAFIDADTAADENWLSDLVEPFKNSQVGATTGHRWFNPRQNNIGSYLRQHWNAAAIVQMSIYRIAWGGSLAIRRSAIIQCELREKWGRAFCEDTMLSHELEQQNLELVRVPDLMAENTESTSTGDAFWWIVRQLITVRLYHPKWPLVLAHGLATGIASIVTLLVLGCLLLLEQWVAFRVLTAGFVIYQLLNFILLWSIEQASEWIVSSRRNSGRSAPKRIIHPRKALAAFLTQFVHAAACLVAANLSKVRWRGIDYQIEGEKIKIDTYLPFRETPEFEESSRLKSSID